MLLETGGTELPLKGTHMASSEKHETGALGSTKLPKSQLGRHLTQALFKDIQ